MPLTNTYWPYDGIGRPITQPVVGSVIYGYDSAGNRISLKYPDSKVVTYTYDLVSRLAQVSDWQSRGTQYAYDAVGQVLTDHHTHHGWDGNVNQKADGHPSAF